MMYGGQFGRMEGLVYKCWDDNKNLIQPIKLPNGTKFIGGVDWGFVDPFVIKVRAITPGGMHYGVSEFYKSGLTPTEQILAAQHKMQTWGVKLFYADPSEPGLIEDFCRNGVPTVGADNDIARGVGLHYELIALRKYKEFIGACPHSCDERDMYHYPEPKDLKPDQNPRKKDKIPVDQNNHGMDVDRYQTIETYKTTKKKAPKMPGSQQLSPNHFIRLEQLKSGKIRKSYDDY